MCLEIVSNSNAATSAVLSRLTPSLLQRNWATLARQVCLFWLVWSVHLLSKEAFPESSRPLPHLTGQKLSQHMSPSYAMSRMWLNNVVNRVGHDVAAEQQPCSCLQKPHASLALSCCSSRIRPCAYTQLVSNNVICSELFAVLHAWLNRW